MRYPLAPLLDRIGGSHDDARRLLGMNHGAYNAFRGHGLKLEQAERYAERAGVHPFEVWPEMRDDVIAEVMHVEPDARSVILHRCTVCGRRQSGELVSEAPERMEALLVCPAGHQERLTVTVEAA